jgi:glyoxylase-like metal-dependent hydrolase (beta-lactamase superfamily II)
MPLLSRRSLLAATAIGALARALPAFAAPPAHSLRHGAFDLTVVSDGYLQLPVSFLAPRAPVEERAALLKAAGQAGDSYHSPTNVTVIRHGDDVILVDTGSGDRFMPNAGKLWANLQAAGIERSAITKVIFTHGHPDHLWGALDEFDELALPDAAFYVAGEEWDFWHGEHAVRSLPPERAGFVTGARRCFEAIREKVKMVRPGDEIVPGLSVVATPATPRATSRSRWPAATG